MHQVSELLKELVPRKGKSNASVAAPLGISGQLLGQYINGRQEPKINFYKKWKEVYGDDLLQLLETNVSQGTKFTEKSLTRIEEKEEFYGQPGVSLVESQSDVKSYLEERRKKKNHGALHAIPVYETDIPASKSEIVPFDDKNNTPVDYLYVPEFTGCVAVNVYSDSMDPLLKPGSRMFIKKIDHWQDALEYGQIYIVSLNDGRRFLKYVKRSKKEDTHLRLVSHNTFYEDFEIPKKLIKSIWMVDGYMNKRTQSTFQLLKK